MQNTYIKFLSVISIARIHTVSNAVLGRAERVNAQLYSPVIGIEHRLLRSVVFVCWLVSSLVR